MSGLGHKTLLPLSVWPLVYSSQGTKEPVEIHPILQGRWVWWGMASQELDLKVGSNQARPTAEQMHSLVTWSLS